MGRNKVSAERLSDRQLAVTAMVAGLSPAVVYAGRAMWFWLLLWSGVAILLVSLVLWRLKRKVPEKMGWSLKLLYGLWAVVLAARVLKRVTQRLELTSGGSPGFWLLIVIVVPLIVIGWGKTAPFFRMVEILWLAMAAVLLLVLGLGIGQMEWRYVTVDAGDWKTAALAAGEIMIPVLFLVPYIYSGEGEGKCGRYLGWLAGLGAVSAAVCLLITGILGACAESVEHAFYVAAGAIGKSARAEGMLSVFWLLSDLTFVGLLCRYWGDRYWPAVAAVTAAAISLIGVVELLEGWICVLGSLVLLGVTIFYSERRRDFVAEKSK